MGKKASEPLGFATCGELEDYLHRHHAAYMRIGNEVLYLTDVRENQWRVQDTAVRNSKNHFVDCTPIVPTLSEMLALPLRDGRTIREAFADATFYASVKRKAA